VPVVLALLVLFGLLGGSYFLMTAEQSAFRKQDGTDTPAVPPAPKVLVKLPDRIYVKRCGGADGWAYLTKEDPSKVFSHRANGRQVQLQYRSASGRWQDYEDAGFFATQFRLCAREKDPAHRDEDVAGKWLSLKWHTMDEKRAQRIRHKVEFEASVRPSLRVQRCGQAWEFLDVPRHASFEGYNSRGPILVEYRDEHGVWIQYNERLPNRPTSGKLRFCALFPMKSPIFKFTDAIHHPVQLKWKRR